MSEPLTTRPAIQPSGHLGSPRPRASAAQAAAIGAPVGPVLVVAGPGAGKTFCLIGRIEYLVTHCGISPERICAFTFTNRAAEEIGQRLLHDVGAETEGVTRGTLHAVCAQLLREFGDRLGLPRSFGIADETYQGTVLQRLKVFREGRRRGLLTLFGRRRLQAYRLTPGDERLFQQYQEYLQQRNLLDFDDILVRAAELLTTQSEAAEAIAGRWDAILVDEFQDLDITQYEILKRLAERHRNVFAVGDDEQSIFGWRGADPGVLRRFAADFGIGTPIILDRNLRCSRQIFVAARKLVAANPALFTKEIGTERLSPHEVRAHGFPDDEAEGRWVLNDLRSDQAAAHLGWGSYAILYRKHQIGQQMEGLLVTSGIPCRLAPRQALEDDPAITYVVRALRLMRSPEDPVLAEAFAERVLPRQLLEAVQRQAAGSTATFLDALRMLAREGKKDNPETKKLWRLIYQIENIRSLPSLHSTLEEIVLALLATRVGEYRSVLEDRHEELSDPADDPAVVQLAARLGRAMLGRERVWVDPGNGVGLAIRLLLVAGGVTTVEYLRPESRPEPDEFVLSEAEAGSFPLPLAVFKAIQYLLSQRLSNELTDFVAFDLETTGKDPANAEIVEVGAVRVRSGLVVESFHSLVRPSVPITTGAQELHGYSEQDVRDAPAFAEVWPRLREFFGEDLVLAHNGFSFDVPVLRRMVAELPGTDREPRFFDTLPLARSLVTGRAGLERLAELFHVDLGRSHHALDDARTLAAVAVVLGRLYQARLRKTLGVQLLDLLGLGLALADETRMGREATLLGDLARPYTLGRFSRSLEDYQLEQERLGGETLSLDAAIRRLGGPALLERIRRERSAEQRYPSAVGRLRTLLAASQAGSLGESLVRFLDQVALSGSQGVEADPHRVNLLTLHAAKGLEFSRVYILGVEDAQLPGTHPETRPEEVEEARRLLYVGMTRARERLVLTRVDRRAGIDAGGSRFLEEMGLVENGELGAGS